jgi:tRNA-specific 2-thiouridylase
MSARGGHRGISQLLRGIDPAKDQSYFLWTLTQDQLKHILFPVGHLPKPEVRKLAKKFGLPTATKKDSQGICFIGDISMKEFLSHYIPSQRGDVLNESGEVIGYHDGALFFTMGERHGFIITKKGTDDVPLYVIDKNVEKNTITVAKKVPLSLTPEGSPAPLHRGAKKESSFSYSPLLYRRGVRGEVSFSPNIGEMSARGGQRGTEQIVALYDVNDISHLLVTGMKCQCQIRYHGEIKQCSILSYDESTKTASVVLDIPDITISSGQSLVLYEGEVCLGGGVIS